jgi:nicotinamidase/pyrazinamidase
MNNKSLIMIDLQNDFCQGGSLAVPEGDKVIPLANQLQNYFDLVVATQDWHPLDHGSFAINHPGHNQGEVIIINGIEQILWSQHCVQHSKGAEFHANLQTQKINKIFYKGIDKNIDSYSAFYDNKHLRSTGLGEYLQSKQIQDVYIMGLATEYCVKYSALDARQLGFNAYVIIDACRGIELKPGDIQQSIDEMQAAGVKIIYSKNFGN